MTIINFYPYPLILGLLILAFTIARQRKRGWLYLSASGLFGIYLMGVVNIVAFPILLPQNWPTSLTWRETALSLTQTVNLVPFNYGNMFLDFSAGLISPNIVLREIGGNILLTVPLGLGVNLFYPVCRRHVFWLAMAAGLVLEVTQLLIIVIIGPSLHSVDINDVLLNALGVLIGYGLYPAAIWGLRQMRSRFAQSRVL